MSQADAAAAGEAFVLAHSPGKTGASKLQP